MRSVLTKVIVAQRISLVGGCSKTLVPVRDSHKNQFSTESPTYSLPEGSVWGGGGGIRTHLLAVS